MYSTVVTAGTYGIDGFKVIVETDISKGLPGITIVGLPDSAVKEAKDRIKSAISNSFFNYPITKKIIINLAPADVKKTGSHYDLPMAISILTENLELDNEILQKTAFFGELSLDGSLNRINACTALILGLVKEKNISQVIIPASNKNEASMVPDLDIFLAENLAEVVEFLRGEKQLPKVDKFIGEGNTNFENNFSDIKGSLVPKRAAEISAAGFHNLLMIGPPGSGKTMIASRMNTIMPKLTEEEFLQVSKIYSFLGNIPEYILNRTRPFRAPHQTITLNSLVGGGNKGIPGEVVLSHNGILFMDEFLNFDKKIIQGLRQPIEDRKVTISRVNFKYTYPCNFLLVIATNPCPCGNYLNPFKECRCSDKKIHDYLFRASSPILDRIDIFVETTPIPYEDLAGGQKDAESSEDIKKRVLKAIEIQTERYKKLRINYNSQLGSNQIKKYCALSKPAEKLLENFFKKYSLTARSYHRILKVSRTIADLDGSGIIEEKHVAESVSFRKVFSKYWESI